MGSNNSGTAIVWETFRNGDSARSDFESHGHAVTVRACYYANSGWTIWLYVDHKTAGPAHSFPTFRAADEKAAELVRECVLKAAT